MSEMPTNTPRQQHVCSMRMLVGAAASVALVGSSSRPPSFLQFPFPLCLYILAISDSRVITQDLHLKKDFVTQTKPSENTIVCNTFPNPVNLGKLK